MGPLKTLQPFIIRYLSQRIAEYAAAYLQNRRDQRLGEKIEEEITPSQQDKPEPPPPPKPESEPEPDPSDHLSAGIKLLYIGAGVFLGLTVGILWGHSKETWLWKIS